MNAPLARILGSGVGLRQSARVLGLSPNGVRKKAAKVGLQLLHAHHNLVRRVQLAQPTLYLDEMETFEQSRRTRPLTLPIVMDELSRFVLAADADLLPARGRLKPAFEKLRDRDERLDGRRRNRSSRVVGHCLGVAARAARGPVKLICDEKRTYPILARRAFGQGQVFLEQHSSKLPRTTANPLFPINHCNAIFRDLTSRLRRRSWLASKKRRFLRIALAITVCFKNYVRPRFNTDRGKVIQTPAQFAGVCATPLRFEQLLSWRQDWGPRSRSLPGTLCSH